MCIRDRRWVLLVKHDTRYTDAGHHTPVSYTHLTFIDGITDSELQQM